MKKILLVSCCLFFHWMVFSQENPEKFFDEHPHLLDRSLVNKDTLQLNKLLHSDLSLGHSNGWMENKQGLLQTLMDEGVIYKSIQPTGILEITHRSEKLLTTRRDIDVEGIVNDNHFSVKLNVLEIWTCENGYWQLLARQSVNRK